MSSIRDRKWLYYTLVDINRDIARFILYGVPKRLSVKLTGFKTTELKTWHMFFLIFSNCLGLVFQTG